MSRNQKCAGRADDRGKGNKHRAPKQSKYCTADQGCDGGAGQGEPGDQDIDDEINRSCLKRRRIPIIGNLALLFLEVIQVKILPEVKYEVH